LAQRFVEDDRNRVGEVEAAHARLEDRNAVGGVAAGREEIRAEALGLAAENQKIATAIFGL